MALSCNVKDREFQKFCEDGNGDTAVRTCTEITGGTIEASPAGLGTDYEVTTQDVTSTEVKLPATPLTGRNSLSIFNSDLTEVLYIGKTGVTADAVLGSTSGWEIGPQETINLDFKDTVEIYGIAPAGKTIRVKIFEVA